MLLLHLESLALLVAAGVGEGGRGSRRKEEWRRVVRCTFDSNNFNSQDFDSGVSNPRTIAYVHFIMPFGAGPISPD